MQDVGQFIQEARKFFFVRRAKFKRKARSKLTDFRYGPWRKLGAGYYGEAWAHDDHPALALKISGPQGWGYDYSTAMREQISCHGGVQADVWPDFAEACMHTPHPNLPEIYHLERHGEYFAWGVMPKYVEYDGAHYSVPAVIDLKRAIATGRAEQYWLTPLLDIARQRGVQLDLHSGNVMMNPDTYEAVITDPFSSNGYGYCMGSDSDRTEYDFSDDECDETDDDTADRTNASNDPANIEFI
jgi:hypothetical protein